MAESRFAYVRSYELPDPVLPGVYVLIRIDGKGFHKFSSLHNFTKPNDFPALELMNRSALSVCSSESLRGQITLAFGESDEYSFLLRPTCNLYNRRASKILTFIVSLFTSSYVYHWNDFFPTTKLAYPPTFDGRLVTYPTSETVRDYFAWRQADTHINNLYNTTFWALVLQGGKTEREAHEKLKGTFSKDKNQMLWADFGINYAKTEAIARKGTTIVWTKKGKEKEEEKNDEGQGDKEADQHHATSSTSSKQKKNKRKDRDDHSFHYEVLHVDIIAKDFWSDPPNDHDAPVATSEEQDSSTPPWEHQSRLYGPGKGRWVLQP